MKGTGNRGKTNFQKTVNTAGGYANFHLKEYDMKAKDAGGYAFFKKHVKKPQLLEAQTH